MVLPTHFLYPIPACSPHHRATTQSPQVGEKPCWSAWFCALVPSLGAREEALPKPLNLGRYLGRQSRSWPRDLANLPYLQSAFTSPESGALAAAASACRQSTSWLGQQVARLRVRTSCLEGRSLSWNLAKFLQVLG